MSTTCSGASAPSPKAKWITARRNAEGNAALLAMLELVGTDIQAFEASFSAERNRQIDADCGQIDNVKRLVNAAKKKGLVEDN